MTRIKFVLAALLSAALLNLAPQLHAQITVKVVLAGSSALWQSMALAAYKGGACVSGGTAPCFHYTAKNFNLIDSRPTAKGGANAVDPGNLWVVWDSNSTSTNVWAYIRVDSGVGDRCYFGQPRCTVSLPTVPAPANLIAQNLWGDNSPDTAPPSAIVALLQGGTLAVNAAATDIRPEDALFATCRANSALGGGVDGLAGLGYGTNASGVCPTFGATLAKLQGSDIQSAYPGSTSTAHILAFNLSGKDPFTGTAIPAATTTSVGASPVIFITSRQSSSLANATNITDAQAQLLFSGGNCDAGVLGGASGPIQVYLREPLSGTMNTTEFTNFRLVGSRLGSDSQEEGVNPGVPSGNPLNQVCASGGGSRKRGIGTGEIVNNGLKSITDSIGYIFFSYGNVSALTGVAKYLTLNGVDPLQSTYTGGTLPTCTAPCPKAPGTSFPNLRNGTYRSWSVLRVVTDAAGTNLTNVSALVTVAQNDVNSTVPDFVPYKTTNGSDPGLSKEKYRSHYTQSGLLGNNGLGGQTESGGDVGGCIETVTPPPGILNCRQ